MLVSQKIESLLNGVSQQPGILRHPSQAEAVENCLPHQTLGLLKRPPTQHVAVLDAITSGYENAAVFAINQSSTEKYFVVVGDGKIKAFDAITGAEVTVTMPDVRGITYLGGSSGYSASTVGDFTFVVNKGITVKRGTTKAPAEVFEALLFIRQADFSTTYSVTLDGTTVEYTTVDAANATSRAQIATTNIAAALMELLQDDIMLSQQFTFTQYGSTIHLTRQDGRDFSLTTTDGLADKGLRPIKGVVQSFDELPVRAKHGMVVEITGAPESEKDNYWVQYDDSMSPGEIGVWRECPKPGTITNLDESTMPWALVLRGEYRDRMTHTGAPPNPLVYRGGTTVNTVGWDEDADGDIHIKENLTTVQGTLPVVGSGTKRLRVNYDVDSTLMEHGRTVIARLKVNTGAGFITVAEKEYNSGIMAQDEYLEHEEDLADATPFQLELEYPSLDLPTDSRKAQIVARRPDHQRRPGVEVTVLQSTEVSFDPSAVYPTGALIEATVNGTLFSYTVVGDTETGTTVAEALRALIDANASFIATATSAGTFRVSLTATSRAPATVSIGVTLSPTTTFVDTSLTLTLNELVGLTIKNLTDGSEGVITSNGTTHIVCSAGLSGGADNLFTRGDICTVAESGAYFVFKPVDWAEREAGDLELCPFPSFVERTLDDVFFYKNRLGVTSGENVVLSSGGDLFNYFRYSQAQLLDDDVIDVKGAFKERTAFRHAIPWSLGLLLASDVGPFVLHSGDQALSPKTVRIDPITSLSLADVRPVSCGDSFFFASNPNEDSEFASIFEMKVANSMTGIVSATAESTLNVPRLLAGNVIAMAGDGAVGFLAVLSDDSQDTLFVYSWKGDGESRTMTGWHKWTFTGATVRGMQMTNNGVLGLFVERAGSGMCFEIIDVKNPIVEPSEYVDRAPLTSVAYTQRYRLSPIYYRDENNIPKKGRTTVRYIDVHYSESTDFTVTVTTQGRSAKSYVFSAETPESGTLRVPIRGRGDRTVIEVTSSSGACRLALVEWEGTHLTKVK